MTKNLWVATVALAAGAAWAQTAAVPPAFEVASVKQSAGAGGEGMRGSNVRASPGSLNMRNVTLRAAIAWAYKVTEYQVSGPGWLESERYGIVAKASGPAAEDEMRPMLQTLLADRFKLALHRQTKEFQVYALLIGKNGPKFHESQTQGESNIQPQKDRMAVVVERTPLSQLVDVLTNVFRAPVLDMTGLKGKYDITINVAKYIGDMQGAGGAPPDPLTIIMTCIQEELGLKLESRKVPLDLLVIDRAEKLPTEN